MSVLGIIAEYNPFHNGHLYHLRKSRLLTGARYVVCVMSGNFIQRGGPAIADKWSRAEMALSCGADLVIELPAVYAMSSAEYFAGGGVSLLNSLGIVDFLSFGSECGNLDEMKTLAEILSSEPAEYKAFLKDALDTGISYPAARESALMKYLSRTSCNGFPDEALKLAGIIKSPNNILGIEYLKAIMRTGSVIKPVTVGRTGSAYNSEELQGTMSSATAIRKSLQSLWPEYMKGSMTAKAVLAESPLAETLPTESLEILLREFEAGRGPVFP
ncbi:MAG: nucleotidyltransferase family protein, partial [Clostridiales bacterium]|nr:nucleotidyltransferase family protein [Clostridiales bacterium]